MTASALRLASYHFRDSAMHEVDIVLERDDERIAGIEGKAAATVKSRDFAGLRALVEASKVRFAYGVVLDENTDLVPFGDRLAAAPHCRVCAGEQHGCNGIASNLSLQGKGYALAWSPRVQRSRRG